MVGNREMVAQDLLGRIADLEAEIKLQTSEVDILRSEAKAMFRVGMIAEPGRAQAFFDSKEVSLPYPYREQLTEEIGQEEMKKRMYQWKCSDNKSPRESLRVTLLLLAPKPPADTGEGEDW